MENDYVDFKFDDHWASEFNLVAVSNGDRYNPPIYGSVNSNTTTVMGKKGVYKWESQVNEKVFTFSIAFDSVTIAQLNDIKKWLEPHKVAKLILSEEPYKYYWVALNDEVDFSHLPFIENEKMVGDRKVIEGVYKGEITISFICVANDGYSEEGNYEGVESDPELKTVKGNNFVLTDADDDNIEDIKLEGHSEQEVKLNNDLTDTDFEDADNTWEVNNLATFSAENEEISVNAPYEFSGIAQEQRESIIGHKYYASAEVNTDSLDTALEIAGKNITNSKSGQTIEIDDGLIGKVDDLKVEGNSQQETKYNNEINSSFLEDLDNWDTINDGTVTRNKQEATITAQNQFDGITQDMEESNVGDKYYISAKVQADNTAALEVETQIGTAQGEKIELVDSADREVQEFKLYGKSEQESYDETVLGENESIVYNNNNNYSRYTKVEVTGNTEQETAEGNDATVVEINDFTVLDNVVDEDTDIRVNGKTTQEVTTESGTTIEGENLTVNGITNTNKRLIIKGQTKQETRDESGTVVTGESINVNDVTLTTKKLGISGNSKQETRSKVAGVTVENEVIRATDVELENGRIRINGNSKQETATADEGITVEGESINVNDIDSNKVGILKIKGNNKQNNYEGNQLVDFNNLITSSSTTYNFINDILTVNGTNKTYTRCEYDVTNIVKAYPGKKLYFSYESIDISNQYATPVQMNVTYNDGTSTKYQTLLNHDLEKSAYTIPSNATNIATALVCFYSNNSSTVQDSTLIITKPMLQFGNEEKTYEPYVGVETSPNPDYPQEIHAVGDDINLFDKDNANILNAFINGTTRKIENGGSTKSLYISCQSNTTYTISRIEGSRFIVGTYTQDPVDNRSEVANSYISKNNVNSLTITTGNNDKWLVVYFYHSSYDTLTEQEILDTVKIQKGSIASIYSPYEMGSCNIEIKNKNLAKINEDAWLLTDDNVIENKNTNSGVKLTEFYVKQGMTIKYSFILKVKPTSSVSFSMYKNDQVIADGGFVNIQTYNLNQKVTKTYIVPEDAVISFKMWGNANSDTFKFQCWAELDEATSYVPCLKQNLAMFCQKPMLDETDYFDLNYKKEIHNWKQIILDGTETWKSANSTFYLQPTDYLFASGITCKCSHYTAIENVQGSAYITTEKTCCMYKGNGNHCLYIKDTAKGNITSFKTWLAEQYANGTPVIVWYKLAEAEELTFTPEQIEAANQIKNMQLYDGQTNIYSTDEVSPNFELNYNRVWASPGINAPSRIAAVGEIKLPNEYQRVEYIESTGTQYINLDRATSIQTVTKLKIKSAIQWTDSTSSDFQYMGAHSGSYFGQSENKHYNFFGVETAIANSTTNFDKIEGSINYKTKKVDYKVNNISGSGTRSATLMDSSFYLFALKNTSNVMSYYCKCKIKYVQFYEDNNMIFYLVPCYRKSDNEIGVYDIISETFYTNEGTGTFLKGNNVENNTDINIKMQSKNLLPMDITSQTINGVTVTKNDNGSITINGTPTTNFSLYFTTNPIHLSAGTYTYSLTNKLSSINMQWQATNSDYTNAIIFSNTAGYKTLTYTEPITLTSVFSWLTSDKTFDNVTITPMIEKGSLMSEYVPHEEKTYSIPTQQPMRKVDTIKDAFIKKADGNWYERHWIRELKLKVSDMDNTTDIYPGWRNQTQLAADFPDYNNTLNMITSFNSNITNLNSEGIGFNSSGEGNLLTLRNAFFNLTQTQWKTLYPDLIFQLQYVAPTPTDLLCTAEQTEVLEQLNNCTLYMPETNIYSLDEVAPLTNLRYNYVPAMPSIEAPSEVEIVGDDINLIKNIGRTNTYKGITYTINTDETIVANGTKNEPNVLSVYISQDYNNSDLFLPGQYLFYNYSEDAIPTDCFLRLEASTTPNATGKYLTVDLTRGAQKQIVTLTQNSYIKISVAVGTATTINNWKVALKLQKFLEKSHYSSYNMGNVNAIIANKNLFTGWVENESLSSTSGVIIASEGNSRSDYIHVDFNKFENYFISNFASNSWIWAYDENKQPIARSASGLAGDCVITINTFNSYKKSNNEIKYIMFRRTGLDYPSNTQVEIGTTATTYVEHQKNIYNIPTQRPMLEGDYFDFTREEEVHIWKKLILTGTENWTKSTNQTVDRFLLSRNGMMPDIAPISNYFIGRIYRIAADIGMIKNNNGGQLVIDFSQYGETSLEDFKTWLINRNNEGNPVIVYYKLENNEQLSLTATQKEVANQIRNAQAYLGTTNIYSENKVSPIFDLKYNYLSQLPSVESPSEIKNVGNDINLFDKDNAQYVENLYIDSVQLKYVLTNTGIRIYYMACKPNTTYTYSKSVGSIVKLASSVNIPVANGAVTTSNLDSSVKSATITTGANDNYIVVLPLNSSELATISWEDVLSSIKLQEGSIATPYSSYNMGNVNIIKCNKNWLDSNTVKSNYRLAQDGGELSDEGYYVSDFIKIKPNTTYTKNSPTADAYHRMCFYSSNNVKSFISRTESNTATSPSNAQYLKICGLITEIDTTQIEKNTAATSYTSHEEEVFNFPLAINQKLLNGSYLTETGIMHKRKQIVLDGTENWALIQNKNDMYSYQITLSDTAIPISNTTLPVLKCNQFTTYKADELWSADKEGTTINISKFLQIKTIQRTLVDFKAWLAAQYAAGTPVIVEYELKNEIKDTYTTAQLASYKQIKASELYSDTSNLYSMNSTAPLLNLTYNYVPESPSVDKESRIRTVGENINLFDGVWESGSFNGVGEKTANANYIRSANFIPIKELTNYIFSTEDTTLETIIVYEYDENHNSNITSGKTIPVKKSFTTNKGTRYIRFRTGQQCTNISTLIKLEETIKASAYSTYNKSNISIVVSNKNLIGLGQQLNGYRNGTTAKFVAANGAIGYCFPTALLPDTITFNCINGNRAYVSYYDRIPTTGTVSTAYSNTTDLPRTIEINKNYPYMHIQFSYDITNVSEIQVEPGSVATSYIAHEEQKFVFPLETNQRLFRDGYLAYNGIHNKRTKVTLTGLENWTVISTSSNYTYYTTLSAAAIDNATVGSQYCTHFKHNLTNASSGIANYFGIDNTGKLYICVKDFNTAADWKAYLQAQYANGTPLEVEYETQTETITPYTQTQQQVYNQIKQTQMYLGTSIIYSDNETAPILKTYYNETKLPSVLNLSEIRNSGDKEGNIQIKLSNKNLFNNNVTPNRSPGNYSKIDTGVRETTFSATTGAVFSGWWIKDLKNDVGKIVRLKADFTSNSTNKGRYFLGLGYADHSANTAQVISTVSGQEISFTVPQFNDDKTWLTVYFYANYGGTGTAEGYVDYTNIMLTIDDNDLTYIDHQEKIVTFPLSAGQKLFEGSYLAKDGIHHNRRQIVYDGTDSGNWWKGSYEFTNTIPFGRTCAADKADATGYCNLFKMQDSGLSSKDFEFCQMKNVNQQVHFKINKNRLRTVDVAGWCEFLAEQYAKGEPLTIEYITTEEYIDTYTAAQQTVYNQLMYLTIYEGYNIIYSTNEIEPTLKWSIPKSPSPDYPIEINSVGDSGTINTNQNNKNWFGGYTRKVSTAGILFEYIGDGTITITGTATTNAYSINPEQAIAGHKYNTLPTGTYTISKDNSNYDVNIFELVNDNWNNLGNLNGNVMSTTITLNKLTNIAIRVKVNSGITIDAIARIQIESGSIASFFIPYKSQLLSFPVQQPMRGIDTTKDCFFKNTIDSEYYNSELDLDCWYERHMIKEKILNGTEGWNKGNTGTNIKTQRFYLDLKNQDVERNGRMLASHLPEYINPESASATPIFNYDEESCGIQNGLYLQMRVSIDIASTITDFKAFLAQLYENNDPLTIIFTLANPTYIKCTQEQSNLLDSLQTYRNKTTFYNEDLVQPTLNLKYIKNPIVQAQTSGTSQQLLSALYTQQIDNGRVLVSNLADSTNSIKFTNPVQVNLTKQFGSGKEPTKEWCDQNLTFFNCAEGGAPSPETPSPIWSVGDNINLFNPTQHIELEGQYRYYTNGTILTNGDYNGLKIPVLGNTNYVISCDIDQRNKISNLIFYDKNSHLLWGSSFSSGEYSFRTPNNCHYITLAVHVSCSNFKIELGSISTTYSDYNKANIDTTINTGHEIMIKSFPLASGQRLLVGDYIDEDGIHHKRGRYIITGTENWSISGTQSNPKYGTRFDVQINNKVGSKTTELFNTHFPYISPNYGGSWANSGTSKLQLRIQTLLFTTVAELKTWLAAQNTNGTPVIVEYEMISETLESFTPAQQEWYDNFMIYTKNNTISTQATVKPYYSFTYDIDDTYNVQSTKTNEFEKLGLIFDNLEDRPRFIVDNIGETASQFTMRNPIIVDLTNEYGAGHEPDLAWCQENIDGSNTCEYGTPSPKVPSEPLSVGANPIRIETKGRNILDEGELTNWTTDTCEVEKLTEKYESRNVYKVNYKNHFTGTIYYQLLKKDTDMVFSTMIRTAGGNSATANKIIINKQITSGWTAVTSINLPNSNDWQKVSVPIAKSLLENAIAWRIEFAHTEATTDNAALEVCMMQLEEGFTPHDYIPYSPATVNNLIFPEPLRSLPNGTKDVMTKEGIVRAVGKYTLQSNKTGAVAFSSNPAYIIAIGQTGIYIKDDISSEAPQFYCNRFRNVDALDDIMTVHDSTIVSYREKEGIGITDTQFAICVRADLIGAIATDTSEQLKTKFNTWLDTNPVILYYEKERTELEPLTELQTNTINNLTTRQLYDAWTINGEFDTELELTYRSSTDAQTIEPWVTASNLLNKTNLYKDNNIHTKSYIEVDNGDATKSGITSSRPVYLLNSGTTNAELNIKFDYINIVSPLTIKVIKGKFDDEGFNEIAQVSEITINPFTSYKPFIDMYDGNSDNWYIDIDSELQEIYLKHKTDTTKVLSLNKFNENYSFLTLADCNFVDYYKVFPTIISEIEGTAIENTVFNKVVLGLSAENYRLKNATLEWKHTYL